MDRWPGGSEEKLVGGSCGVRWGKGAGEGRDKSCTVCMLHSDDCWRHDAALMGVPIADLWLALAATEVVMMFGTMKPDTPSTPNPYFNATQA